MSFWVACFLTATPQRATEQEKFLKKFLYFVVDRNENVLPLHREIKREKLLPLREKIATLKGNKKRG